MWPIVTDRVAWSVCRSVCHTSESCKTAEPIEMPCGLRTRVGRRKHKFNRIRQVAPMCPHERAHWRKLANTIEPCLLPRCGLMSNYFDHLLSSSSNRTQGTRVMIARTNCQSVYVYKGSHRTQRRSSGRSAQQHSSSSNSLFSRTTCWISRHQKR